MHVHGFIVLTDLCETEEMYNTARAAISLLVVKTAILFMALAY